MLPRTGETTTAWLGALGVAIAALTGFAYRSKKEKG
ncbi:LPXTG cell wall anchor domain-containing protein [Streptococcus marmotae]